MYLLIYFRDSPSDCRELLAQIGAPAPWYCIVRNPVSLFMICRIIINKLSEQGSKLLLHDPQRSSKYLVNTVSNVHQ